VGVLFVGPAWSVGLPVGGWWLVFGRGGKQRLEAVSNDGKSVQIGEEELQRSKVRMVKKCWVEKGV